MKKEILINIGKCFKCGKVIDNSETDYCFECSQEDGYTGEDTK